MARALCAFSLLWARSDNGGRAKVAADQSVEDGEGGGAAGRPVLRAVSGPEATSPDGDLVARVARGDEQSFEQLIDRHLGRLIAEARSVVRDAAEAEDIAQETFLRLWRQAGQLTIGLDGARPWLVRVARNLAVDRIRAGRRVDVTDEVPEQSVEPEQLRGIEAGETARRIEDVMRELPERQRLAVMLFHHEGLSLAETAASLGVSAEAVESLLARARRALRRDLAAVWQDLKGGGDTG